MGCDTIDPEINAFSKKAARYLAALNAVPNARLFEVLPVLATIEGLQNTGHSQLRIGDAMAGSGYLSRYLSGSFGSVISLEACERMIAGGERGANYVKISEAKDIPLAFSLHNISLGVSLASFHHLVVTDDQGTVNQEKSWQRQCGLIKTCFEADAALEHFLLVDVPSESLLQLEINSWPWASSPSALWRNVLTAVCEDKFPIPNGPVDFELFQQCLLGPMSQMSPRPDRWFREVVHPHSITGHKDCFLRSELIGDLSKGGFRLSAITLPIPWIFESLSELTDFVWDKFAFKESDENFTRTDAVAAAASLLGIETGPHFTILGWKLAFVLISRNTQ